MLSKQISCINKYQRQNIFAYIKFNIAFNFIYFSCFDSMSRGFAEGLKCYQNKLY